jgi:hypothetical protein
MNFKKYLSVLMLTLTCASSTLKTNDYSEYSLVGDALHLPGRTATGAADIVEAPVDAVLGDDDMYYHKPKYQDDYALDNDTDLYTGADSDMYDDIDDASDDSLEKYNYQNYNYGYDADTDSLEKETDYNAELE